VARLESYADLKLHSPRSLPGAVITTTLGLPIGSAEVDVLKNHLTMDTFMDKSINTAKRNVSVQRAFRSTAQQYNLAYFNLWWVRMAVEGRKEAKERRRKEEEESRRMRKSKWRTSRRRGVNEKDTKVDGTKVNPIQIECQHEENTLRGGTDTYRGKSERRGGEGVELPTDDTIYEWSQAMNSITSTSNNGISDFSKIVGDKDLAPGSSAVDLLE
jgi:hypothetical protein